MTSSERIGLLMYRYLRNKLSAKEERELDDWRYANPDNEVFFQSTTDAEYLQNAVNGMFDSKETIYNQLREEFPGSFPVPASNVKKIPKVYYRMQVAATVALLLCFGWQLFFHEKIIPTENLLPGTSEVGIFNEKGIAVAMTDLNRGYKTSRAGISLEKKANGDYIYHASSKDLAALDLDYKLYTAGNGQLDLRLPDGSRILLNGNSTIRYPQNLLQDSLKIFIEGEAWIELPKTKHHVIIFLKNKKIEAVDAALDAEAYPDDSVSRITMVTGIANLLFSPEGSLQKNLVHLNANQEAISSAKKIEIKEAGDTAATISWKNGRIHFTNAGVQTIMRSIEHGYGVQVEYRGKIPDQKFSLYLPRDTKLGMVLMKLYMQGLHNSIDGNTIVVQQKETP